MSVGDGRAHLIDEMEGPGDVVPGHETRCRRLVDLEEVPQISDAVTSADVTGAGRIERLLGSGVSSIRDVHSSRRREGGSVSSESGLHHTIELIDSKPDGLDERGRIPHPHEIPGSIRGQVFEGGCQGRNHLIPSFADR